MYHEVKPLSLFVVAPKGYENKLSVVVAVDKKEATIKALRSSDIEELVLQGVNLQVLNVTSHFEKQGYSVVITHEGMFH